MAREQIKYCLYCGCALPTAPEHTRACARCISYWKGASRIAAAQRGVATRKLNLSLNQAFGPVVRQSFRPKTKTTYRERYRDPNFAEIERARSREYYRSKPEYREQRKAQAKQRYAENRDDLLSKRMRDRAIIDVLSELGLLDLADLTSVIATTRPTSDKELK